MINYPVTKVVQLSATLQPAEPLHQVTGEAADQTKEHHPVQPGQDFIQTKDKDK